MKNKQVKSRVFHYNFFPKSRNGDVPITILVVGVVAVCALAILSFVIADYSPKNDFKDLVVFEKINSDIEKFYFYKNAVGASDAENYAGAVNGVLSASSGGISVEYELP